MLIAIVEKNIIFCFLIIFFIENFRVEDINGFGTTIEAKEYIIKDNKYYLKLDIIKKFNLYLKVCKQGILFEKKKFPLLKNPKISIIIPIYNGGKYLNYSLKSIQNQNLKEIEILIIDDCSTDDSLKYIKIFMEEEPRIRLIKNYKNRKILYSKSIGALNSNGEFILELDQDDMFIRADLFDIIYKEAKKYDVDLVQFRDFVKEEFFFKRRTRINYSKLHWIRRNQSLFIENPNIKDTLFKDNNNYLLWGLLICTEIYKKVIYHIWEFIINYQIIYNEDYISTTMISIFSRNFKYLNIFGIIHLKHQNTASFECIKKDVFHLSNIIFPSYLYKYHIKENPEDIQLIVNYMNLDLNKYLQLEALKLFPKFFEFNIRNIFYNNYLLSKDKKTIIDIFNINRNQSELLSSYTYFMNMSEFNSIFNFQNHIINISSKFKKNIYYIINKAKINKKYFQYIYVNETNSSLKINKIITLKIKKHKRKTKKGFRPKISIILYCNEVKFLEETLNSIIEQRLFFSFEIIIVYDNINKLFFSNNFKYNNIVIINNLNQKGIMYSYTIGVLASKGDYILNFQPGYTLSKKNILENIYNIAVDMKIDILEFNLLINKDIVINENSYNLVKCGHFQSILNTSQIKYNKNYKEIDHEKELLINKLIRAEIYKDIIYKYEFIKYKKVIYNNYDDILMFLLNKQKYIFKHCDIFGVIKNINFVKSLKLNKLSINNEQMVSDSIFYINFLFKHSSNKYNDKKFVYNEFINILGLVYNKFIPKSNKSIKLLDKFINSDYINEIEKQELKFFYNSLNN